MPDGPVVTEADLRAMEDPEIRQKVQEKVEQAAQTVETPPAAPEQITTELDDLQKKVELGQATDEDMKRLEDLEKAAPQAAPDVTYRIAGEEIAYSEAAKRARENIGLGNVDLSREAEKNLVETWVRAQNKTEWSKHLDAEAQTVARGREAVTEQARALQNREREQSERFARSNALLEQVRNNLSDLAEQRAMLQQVIANRPSQTDLYDTETGQLNIEKQADLIRARNAEFELHALDQKEGKLRQNEQALQQQTQEQQNYLAFIEVESFITNIAPEFLPRTTDFATAFSKYTKGEQLEDDDWTRMHELTRILQERDVTGADINKIYQYQKSHGQLTVKGAQTSRTVKGLPTPRGKDEELIQRINKLRERANAAPSRLPSGQRGSPAGPGGVKSPEKLAEEHIRSERAADTAMVVDKSLWEGKVSNPQRMAGT